MTQDTPPVTLSDIRQAATRIAPAIYKTPLIRLPTQTNEPELYAKAESLQRTRSFKLRGAYNFLANLSPDVRNKGVTTHSSGNHAQGLACAAALFGVPAAIAIPEGAPAVKVAATRAWGAEVIACEGSREGREAAAQQVVRERGFTLVPPFDHPWIVAGQGTVGLEIAEALDVANVLVCAGGGGLLAGVTVAIRSLCPDAQIIGVEPELAADATESFYAGALRSWPAEKTTRTIADGVRTQSLGQINFEIIKRYVHGFVTVSEQEIVDALRWYAFKAGLVVEPTGALPLAAFRKIQRGETDIRLRDGKTVLLITGGNVDPEQLRKLLSA